MEQEEYDLLITLIRMQLGRYGIKKCNYEDYYHEVMLYLLNRHGEINIDAKYIYGDIKNGILNHLKKENRNEDILLGDAVDVIIEGEDGIDISELELRDLIKDEDYDYLIIDRFINDYSVTKMCNKYGFTKSKIYYEINKILCNINWVNW